MLSLTSLILLIALAVAAGLFWQQLKASEEAERVARRFCQQHEALFLDDTVQCRKLRLRRDQNGRWRVYRLYLFEYASDWVERGYGVAIFVGDRVQQIHFVDTDRQN